MWQGICSEGINVHVVILAFVHKSCHIDRKQHTVYINGQDVARVCLNSAIQERKLGCHKWPTLCLAPVTGISSSSLSMPPIDLLQKGEAFLFEIISFPSFSKQMDQTSWMNKWGRKRHVFGNSQLYYSVPAVVLYGVQTPPRCSCSLCCTHPCAMRAKRDRVWH